MSEEWDVDVGGGSRAYGAAAIGGRLRRLSERIDQDCARLYADHGVRFEQRWFGVMNELAQGPALSVSKLAIRLGISQASVSQTRKSLDEAGLVMVEVNPDDARGGRLTLSVAGRQLYQDLAPVWVALEAVSVELNQEAERALVALDLLDQALNRTSLYDRVRRRLGGE
ncbi:MAG: MarR family transcriptional regulator [Pseudomonadota bacterium]|uniref:MarR family winged helix-turn-helix transcriptional regulator n=1 Tax=Sphingomonas sp. ERG5 TaxID=1381597 RepID=UPI00054C6E80|nr:MarR family transcriptional regulator [Sphingomonas sp. ERG5]